MREPATLSADATTVPRFDAGTVSLPPTWVSVVAACLAVAALSLLWPHSLTYDPASWALWGREIIHGSLNTRGGTSWKPLPVIFDTVFALFGAAAPALWLIVARAGSLMALVLAYSLAGRAAGRLAGVLAVAWVVLSAHTGFVFGWFQFFGSGLSEGLLTAFALGAVWAELQDKPRVALGAWFAAVLIRPEATVFLLLHGILIIRRDPALRVLLGSLLLAAVLLWVIPDYLGSGQWLRASRQSMNDIPPSLAHARNPGLRDLALFRDLLSPVVALGAVLALALAGTRAERRARTRARSVAMIAAAVTIIWVAIVAVMAQAGYPGIPRFLVVPVALCGVLAGIGWGRAVHLVPRLALRLPLAAAVLAVNVLFLAGNLGDLHRQVSGSSYEATQHSQLLDVLSRIGGPAAIRRCGVVSTNPLEIPTLEWQLGYRSRVSTRRVGSGIILRTRIFGQHRILPAAPPPSAGFRLLARVGVWSAYGRCPAA